jgi:hypothetical protein
MVDFRTDGDVQIRCEHGNETDRWVISIPVDPAHRSHIEGEIEKGLENGYLPFRINPSGDEPWEFERREGFAD